MALLNRNLVPELMDDPELDPKIHQQALRGLQRVNLISRTANRIASEVFTLAKRKSLDHVRVLDLGCGSGDVATQVANQLSKSVGCSMTGWDMSQLAVDTAAAYSKRYRASHTSNDPIQFECVDILSVDPNSKANSSQFDYVFCSLFLHHFSEEQAITILGKMREQKT